MADQRKGPGSDLTFFGMVGAVMTALKLKERWGEYKHVATEEEDGRFALASPPAYNNEEDVGLLRGEQLPPRPRRKRSQCCVCCGVDCSLFWKAFGIVVGVLFLWYAFKLIRWAFSPSPTGLENMPVYSTSLGCMSAPYIYNSSKTTLTVPIGTETFDHAFDTRGSAVGTITIAQGKADSKDVRYKMTIRTDDRNLLKDLNFVTPTPEADGSILNSRLLLVTPVLAASSSCMRYDIKIYLPPTLKKLHVATHTKTHLQFDPKSQISLDNLYITLFAMAPDNMILPHANLLANHMSLEVYRGWVVGDASIVNSTTITTQRGDGILNVRTIPTAPINPNNPEPAYLQTTTGAGRTDVFYVNHRSYPHRPINSVHLSSRNADMYITYRDAEFNGFIELDARSFTTTGMHSLKSQQAGAGGTDVAAPGEQVKWTHTIGDQNGGDRLSVKSRGWAGVYF